MHGPTCRFSKRVLLVATLLQSLGGALLRVVRIDDKSLDGRVLFVKLPEFLQARPGYDLLKPSAGF